MSARPASEQQIKPAETPRVHPLKPRPGLFYFLLVVFVLWIGGLIAMYVTTVYHKTDVHVAKPATQK